ncbi:MAG: hypothetical protein KAR40_13515 [Candidatus Sabulitectum sp.]|nr:hypothetical protein [Candidatus Sabulitectum sp.]
MNTIHRRGSALIMVLIASMFLIILTAGAFRYFQTNVTAQIWTRERIQAKLSAEAGINLATHMLIAGASLPADTLPNDFLGTEFLPMDLPGGMGSVYATVDPNNNNRKIIMANAFLIRCVAFVSGTTLESYGMATIVMPENLARFSVFMDDPSTGGYYDDGYRFDGPFYANGPVWVQSEDFTSENDVFFYSFELTSNYYLYGPSKSYETTPSVGKLEMQPHHRLILGAPYFDLGVDTIPFGSSELNWQGVRNAALANGLFLNSAEVSSGSRLALKGDTLFVKQNPATPAVAYPLGGLVNPVVWIDDAVDSVFLRGDQNLGLDMALTIGMRGSFYMSGPLHYKNEDLQDPDNENLLGLMSVEGDVIIADDPGVDELQWGFERFWIRTDSGFTCSAVLVALDGVLEAENPWEPSSPQEFQILGGYMVQSEGFTGTSRTGYSIGVYFDPRLLYLHPPFFPTTANWNTTMWQDMPDLTAEEVKKGPFLQY